MVIGTDVLVVVWLIQVGSLVEVLTAIALTWLRPAIDISLCSLASLRVYPEEEEHKI